MLVEIPLLRAQGQLNSSNCVEKNKKRVYSICFYVCRAVKNSWPCSPGNSSDMNELKSVFYISYVYLEEKWRVVITHELKLTLM